MKPYYHDGQVTIFHGDCRDILGDIVVRPTTLFTDPPYSVNGIAGDSRASAHVSIALNAAFRVLRKKDCAVVFSASSGRSFQWVLECCGQHLPLQRVLTWKRLSSRTKVDTKGWAWDSVLLCVFGKTFGTAERLSSVFTGESPKEPFHPRELPEELAKWAYQPIDSPDAIVLDPFMGSGTILLPPVRRGRRVVGIEIEERYCEIAAKRLDQCVASHNEA